MEIIYIDKKCTIYDEILYHFDKLNELCDENPEFNSKLEIHFSGNFEEEVILEIELFSNLKDKVNWAINAKDLNYEDGGSWDCTRCIQCVEVCPKGVYPMERIMELREQAIQVGYTNTNGARHAEAVYEDVGHSGWLDELRLPIKTFGIFNFKELIKLIPIGIKSQLVGKRPPIFHKSIPGVQNVRKIFERYKK